MLEAVVDEIFERRIPEGNLFWSAIRSVITVPSRMLPE
jgi:hypothetical protein